MCAQQSSTKTRLIDAALELFAAKGVTETTTKAVAERAQVNEVTLFRHFGSKYGLLLAVMEDSARFAQIGKALVEKAVSRKSVSETFKVYAQESLQALERVPELVRSVVGDAGQYPVENRLALAQGIIQANRYVADSLEKAIVENGWQSHFPAEKLASLLNELILGYFVIKLTSEEQILWDRQEDFLESVVELFIQGAVAPQKESSLLREQIFVSETSTIHDLPSALVHEILDRSKKLGRQEYALAYILFGTGLSAIEIVNLERSNSFSDSHQHILQINCGAVRQVPLNQWIMGKRYGSYTNNPLTKWLKTRKDEQSALFLNREGRPMSEEELQVSWQVLTEGLLTLQGKPPTIEQAQQTWCVEMLIKGIELEDLSILSGINIEQLQPFAKRAREKTAIEQASRLDRS